MRPRLLLFVDAEITEALTYQLRNKRVTVRLGEKIGSAEAQRDSGDRHLRVILADYRRQGPILHGRAGAVSKLNLEAAGIAQDPRGKIKVNHHYQPRSRTFTPPAT